MTQWQKVRVGDFLKLYRIEHRVQNDTSYKQVTISKTKGVIFRGIKQGSSIGRKRQFLIDLDTYPNTLLFTRQGIFDGSIGIAPLEVNQCIVTENMPMMSIDTEIIEIEFLKKLLISEYFIEKIKNLKVVGSAQKSIHERDFLKIEIDIPKIVTQQKICQKFNALNTEHSDLKQEITQQQILLKKLRQQILQEAIEGKLTQDWRVKNPNTEPASELLKRIQAEKQQLIKDKKIKPQKPLPVINEDEKPFKLPDGWVWCQLGEICDVITKGSSPKWQGINYVDSIEKGILFITSKNVNNYKIDLTRSTFVEKRFNEIEPRSILKKGDLLTNIVGASIGRTAIYDLDLIANINQAVCILRYKHKYFSKPFLLKIMNADFIIQLMSKMQFSPGRANLSMNNLSKFPIAMPPLAEQKTIVAKVEKLLNICDKLQTQITANQIYAEQLMQAVLKEAFTQAEQPI